MTMEAHEKASNPFAAPQADLGQPIIPPGPSNQNFQLAKYEDRFNGWVVDRIISLFVSLAGAFCGILLYTFFILFLIAIQIIRYSEVGIYGTILEPLFLFGSFMLAPWLYYAILESGPSQATFGKRLFKTKVTDLEGNRISFGRASARYFSKYLPFYLLLAGYLAQPFQTKKQALHDILAGTLVIKEKQPE